MKPIEIIEALWNKRDNLISAAQFIYDHDFCKKDRFNLAFDNNNLEINLYPNELNIQLYNRFNIEVYKSEISEIEYLDIKKILLKICDFYKEKCKDKFFYFLTRNELDNSDNIDQ